MAGLSKSRGAVACGKSKAWLPLLMMVADLVEQMEAVRGGYAGLLCGANYNR